MPLESREMFNFNEMETSMGFVSSTALHPSDSCGGLAVPTYSNNPNFGQRLHQHQHQLQQQQPTSGGADKMITCDYGDANLIKSSHLAYLGSENVKRFSVNNLLNLVGYTELSRSQGMFYFRVFLIWEFRRIS